MNTDETYLAACEAASFFPWQQWRDKSDVTDRFNSKNLNKLFFKNKNNVADLKHGLN